jgi:putative ABC transport system permease protein
MSLLIGAITMGLILALLALGIFISFRIFNFADLTAEGSVTLGAAVAATMIVGGYNPVLATFIAVLCGFLAGALTGIIHTRFEINGLLAGILVMTALYSVNLHVMGKSNVPLLSENTVFSYLNIFTNTSTEPNPAFQILGYSIPQRELLVLCATGILCLVTGIFLYFFFRTDLGTAMRATGNNQQMIRSLGVNTKTMIILGLAVSNGLVALSGALLAQFQGFADVQMGIGMLVWGLASVIIGEALITDKSFGYLICGAVFGSVIFRLLVAGALRLGMNPNDLKLITAVFVFVALILPGLLKSKKLKFSKYHD